MSWSCNEVSLVLKLEHSTVVLLNLVKVWCNFIATGGFFVCDSDSVDIVYIWSSLHKR